LTSILGISAFYHDSAASLLIDGKIISAVQEERFTRIKHDSNYPFNAVEYVLNYSKLKLSQIDYIIFFEKPFLKFERLLKTYIAFAPRGFSQFSKAIPLWITDKLFQKKKLMSYLKNHDKNFYDDKKLYFSEHHLSHAASAFYPSPFAEAITLTIDGVGEWATTTVAVCRGKEVEIKKEIHFPHSLGLLYSAFTYYIGFKVNSGEYKLMGLAPYGLPKYSNIIKKYLIDIKPDGTFRLNQKYFDYTTGFKMTNEKFNSLFGHKERDSEKDQLTQFHMDIAASIQKVTEEIILSLAGSIQREYNIKNLCLAGGVALNCVANGKILKEKIFEKIWVQPAAGDAGGSLGAALAFWHLHLKEERKIKKNDGMNGSYLGPSYSQEEIETQLSLLGAKFVVFDREKIIDKTAECLKKGKIIGWFQGRTEFGPRALGARSILADARSKEMQKNLNMKIKYRESFRPFAPSVLSEDVKEWFDIDVNSPYMMMVAKVNKDKINETTKNQSELFGIERLNIKRSEIPAITHVDYSARIQTVHKETNPIFHELITKFKEKTGCPVIINTSFNVRGEPIVNNTKDAFNCFMGTELDVLVIGNCFLWKEEQDLKLKKNYNNLFKPD